MKGIYLIENLINHKIYIGQSKDMLGRFYEHMSGNKGALKEAVSKYGLENFSFRVLEKAEYLEELNDLERKWIIYYRKLEWTMYNDDRIHAIKQDREYLKEIVLDYNGIIRRFNKYTDVARWMKEEGLAKESILIKNLARGISNAIKEGKDYKGCKLKEI